MSCFTSTTGSWLLILGRLHQSSYQKNFAISCQICKWLFYHYSTGDRYIPLFKDFLILTLFWINVCIVFFVRIFLPGSTSAFFPYVTAARIVSSSDNFVIFIYALLMHQLIKKIVKHYFRITTKPRMYARSLHHCTSGSG